MFSRYCYDTSPVLPNVSIGCERFNCRIDSPPLHCAMSIDHSTESFVIRACKRDDVGMTLRIHRRSIIFAPFVRVVHAMHRAPWGGRSRFDCAVPPSTRRCRVRESDPEMLMASARRRPVSSTA